MPANSVGIAVTHRRCILLDCIRVSLLLSKIKKYMYIYVNHISVNIIPHANCFFRLRINIPINNIVTIQLIIHISLLPLKSLNVLRHINITYIVAIILGTRFNNFCIKNILSN